MEDIKPIDKFTLDKYVKEEDDLLEYVEMLGCKCHPDYDFIRVKKGKHPIKYTIKKWLYLLSW